MPAVMSIQFHAPNYPRARIEEAVREAVAIAENRALDGIGLQRIAGLLTNGDESKFRTGQLYGVHGWVFLDPEHVPSAVEYSLEQAELLQANGDPDRVTAHLIFEMAVIQPFVSAMVPLSPLLSVYAQARATACGMAKCPRFVAHNIKRKRMNALVDAAAVRHARDDMTYLDELAQAIRESRDQMVAVNDRVLAKVNAS